MDEITKRRPILLREGDLARELSIDAATLRRWAKAGVFPRPVKLGPGSSRWRSDEVMAYLDGCPRVPADEAMG